MSSGTKGKQVESEATKGGRALMPRRVSDLLTPIIAQIWVNVLGAVKEDIFHRQRGHLPSNVLNVKLLLSWMRMN